MFIREKSKVSVIRDTYVGALCLFKLSNCMTYLSEHPVHGCNDDYISPVVLLLEYGT